MKCTHEGGKRRGGGTNVLLAITAVHILFNRGYVANYVCRAICAAERPRAHANVFSHGIRFCRQACVSSRTCV